MAKTKNRWHVSWSTTGRRANPSILIRGVIKYFTQHERISASSSSHHITNRRNPNSNRFMSYTVITRKQIPACCFMLIMHRPLAILMFLWRAQIQMCLFFLYMHVAKGNHLTSQMNFVTGNNSKSRIIYITKIARSLDDDICNSLIGLHAFTGLE
jgi:hypothetical protein